MSLRTGVVILPDLRWQVARDRYVEAEQRGFHTAWTYDHLSWRTLRDGPWLGAIPLLTAAAGVTSTIRLGTLVATPNFRHPALLAKDVMSMDDISAGRFDLGIGAGGTGFDATALGGQPPSPRQRFDRFADFTTALDVMLREPSGSYEGEYFQAPEYRTLPGCVQQPRVPFTVAATGPRGLALTARYATTWVTFGPLGATDDAEAWFAGVASQAQKLDEACASQGREAASLRRMALVGVNDDWADGSLGRWEDFTGRINGLGFTDVVVHWPRPDDSDLPGCSPDVFDAISAGSN
jgi:alkanesulfonate monooxygenase SsuD/methylene tetrahydromethanopterin reductase-like flavin-dependent oxidoreductase (luciferase family)